MTSHQVIVEIQLYLDFRNDEYIILCKFVGRTISDFKVIGGGPSSPRPGPKKPNKARSR